MSCKRWSIEPYKHDRSLSGNPSLTRRPREKNNGMPLTLSIKL